jgi:hypothetical protein
VLTPVRSGQFRRDVKRAEKRGKDLRKLRHALELLIAGEALPSSYRDHPLKGTGRAIGTLTSNRTGCCSIESQKVNCTSPAQAPTPISSTNRRPCGRSA